MIGFHAVTVSSEVFTGGLEDVDPTSTPENAADEFETANAHETEKYDFKGSTLNTVTDFHAHSPCSNGIMQPSIILAPAWAGTDSLN